MVAGGIKSPQRPFNPKGGIDEWEILRRGIKGKPNAPQTVGGGQQLIVRQIRVVVPNETAIPRRPVRQDGHCCQNETEKTDTTPSRKQAIGNLAHDWS